MLSIPTDNPDRAPGWTGDMQMVGPAICYNVDAQAILRRWLRYCRYRAGRRRRDSKIIPNWRIANLIATDSTAGCVW